MARTDDEYDYLFKGAFSVARCSGCHLVAIRSSCAVMWLRSVFELGAAA